MNSIIFHELIDLMSLLSKSTICSHIMFIIYNPFISFILFLSQLIFLLNGAVFQKTCLQQSAKSLLYECQLLTT